jgi:hypothetical protein
VLKFYEHFVGTPPPPDQGCNMRDVLTYWRRTGLAKDKIQAFVSLEPKNQTQAQDALYMFGSIYIGVALPDSVCHGDLLVNPWVVPPQGPVGDAAPDPDNGHCINAVGYDARNLYVVTWGEIKPMSWQFYAAYADEAYAVLSKDFIARNGENSAGFDLAALEADLAQISNIPQQPSATPDAEVTRRARATAPPAGHRTTRSGSAPGRPVAHRTGTRPTSGSSRRSR